MISYRPFWQTLRASKESTYTLIKDHHLSSATIDKLRHNKSITTTTLNDLCRILNCPIEAIVEYIPSDNDQMATCKIYRKKNLNGSTCDIFLCSNGRKE